MASSSKSINMPLIFAVAIGSTVALVAITIFGLAWYEYEASAMIQQQVIDAPTHDDDFEERVAEQREAHQGIDATVNAMVDEHGSHDHGVPGGEHDAEHEVH